MEIQKRNIIWAICIVTAIVFYMIIKKSAKWYRYAAEQEHAESQFCLGLMYSIGYGVSPDMVFVYKWYKLAQLNGHINYRENNK